MSIAAILVLLMVAPQRVSAAPVMGMKIDSVQSQAGSISITTTGTQFVFNKSNNSIVCSQRIPESRQVATIGGLSLRNLSVISSNDQQCVLGNSHGQFTIGADGLLTIAPSAGTQIGITGSYAPAWKGNIGNNYLMPDQTGGVGAYLVGSGSSQAPASWNPGWTVNYQLAASSKLMVPVYPPRSFDAQQANKTVVHDFSWTNPYPSDQELTAWSKVGSILTLHSWAWQGYNGSTAHEKVDGSWATTTFTPKDESELRRVVTTAHSLGMKVIPYTTPYYFGATTGTDPGPGPSTMPDYLNAVRSLLPKYGFDGLYLDGLYINDVEASYNVVRQLRQIIGDDGIMYIHGTGIPLDMACPFIDTYADYTLNGEHYEMTADYARWTVSSYNLGNSVGTFCYDTARPTSEMIDLLLADHARLPYWVGDANWAGVDYYLRPSEINLLNAEYFPKLTPEPSTATLGVMGVAGLLAWVWGRRRFL